MLTAVNQSGEVISLYKTYSRNEIHYLKENGPYFCRECKKTVLLKAGNKRIAHFAHHIHSRCPESYENESQYHLNGKINLYSWLFEQGLLPEMEQYFYEIKQRADIGFTYNDKTYAIEFQCSPISDELLYKRNQSYIQAGIIPIWIVGANKIKRLDHNRIALTGFNYLFLTQHEHTSWHIISFCPNTLHFFFIKNPQPYTTKNAFAQLTFKPLKNLSFKEILFPPNDSALVPFQQWQTTIRKQKNFAAIGQGLYNKGFLNELYQYNITPSFLPSEIGLPVFHSPYISTSPVQWQTYFFLDVIKKKHKFTIDNAKSFFMKRIRNKDLSIRTFPLENRQDEFRAVEEYITLLENLYVLSKTDNGFYYVNNLPHFHISQEEQGNSDQRLNRRFGKFIMNQANQNTFK